MISQDENETGRSDCLDYFDIEDIDASRVSPRQATVSIQCPVKDCTAKLQKVHSQWGPMPFCSSHGLRIHCSSKKFVYYNGPHKKTDVKPR